MQDMRWKGGFSQGMWQRMSLKCGYNRAHSHPMIKNGIDRQLCLQESNVDEMSVYPDISRKYLGELFFL